MKTIINYAKEERRSFKEFPFNDVDSLILSTISYYDFNGDIPSLFSVGSITLKDLDKKRFKGYVKELGDQKKYIELLNNLVDNPRFNTLKLDNYYEKESIEEECGFKGLTIESDKFIYVSFMGTKAASIISWKEDFNLAYLSPLPSQKIALRYLNKVMFETLKPVYVGGHSKGGNQAIYASIHTPLINKLRIKKIFTHDGPGFPLHVFNSYRYKLIKSKISKTVPSSSIVGMLLYSREEYKVIKASGLGMNQHSPLNWAIKNGDFVYLKDLSWSSKHFDKTISNWINNLNKEQKVRFIDGLFSILQNSDFDPMNIPNKNYLKMYSTIRKGLKDLDEETREMVVEVFKKLVYYEKLNLLKSDEK